MIKKKENNHNEEAVYKVPKVGLLKSLKLRTGVIAQWIRTYASSEHVEVMYLISDCMVLRALIGRNSKALPVMHPPPNSPILKIMKNKKIAKLFILDKERRSNI